MNSPAKGALPRVLIVGNPLSFHVGAHFLRAARALHMEAEICDTRRADRSTRFVRSVWWRLADRRAPNMRSFCHHVLEACRRHRPSLVLCTGLSPIDLATLTQMKQMGITTVNFLTDDPWNPLHQSRWFMKSLTAYDYIFSPRKSNLSELAEACSAVVSYLPFGYDPTVHVPATAHLPENHDLASEMLFYGGADRDRSLLISVVLDAGFQLALYGGFWNHFAKAKPYWRGHADLRTIALAVRAATMTLCLVRRSNRDGHVMRSFEVPAMRGCMLTEDTPEHRELFGAEGEAVFYFSSERELIDKARFLQRRPKEREQLARALHHRITTGNNTYADRLRSILKTVA